MIGNITKEKRDRIRVIDLNAGLGGRAYAFQENGCEVVAAIEKEIDVCKHLMLLVPKTQIICEDLLNLSSNDLPDADIILAKYIQPSFSKSWGSRQKKQFSDENDAIREIILIKRPICFMLELPYQVVKSADRYHLDYYLQKYVEYGYVIEYRTFEEADYSQFPMVGKQAYLVGMVKELEGLFHFRERLPQGVYKEFQYEDVEEDSWYRKSKLEYGAFEYGQWYLKERGKVRHTDKIHMGTMRENYLVDEKGVRRFTHNELARIKGLEGVDYNSCSNKNRMYQKIAYASNVFIVKSIAYDMLKCMMQYKDFGNKLKTSQQKGEKQKNQERQQILFPKCILKSMHIDKLKGINDLSLEFDKNLVAIMGTNGIGKSTILHALACVYRPYKDGNEYKFSYFFTPNPHASWKDNKFAITNYDENEMKSSLRVYQKLDKKWSPQYKSRPIRDCFYIGISTCIPEIEIEKSTSFISYTTQDATGRNAEKVLMDSAYILNKDYDQLNIHINGKKSMIGVHTENGITYSALSMGAGEQRVIKILKTVYNANQYSLILIDEIDLLLHADALKKLIIKLSENAKKKQLQIIFTTHSLEMESLSEYVDIKYIEKTEKKFLVYNTIKPDLKYELSGVNRKNIRVYVEDTLAENIILKIARDLDIARYVEIIKYGAIENAFVVAASYIIRNDNTENILIVTDGDKYVSDDEKRKQIKKIFSGTEEWHAEMIEKALGLIEQFSLPEGIAPEKHIHTMLVNLPDHNDEIVECANGITAVNNSHEWLGKIVERLGMGEYAYMEIMNVAAECMGWEKYVKDVKAWLKDRKER